MAIAIVQLTQFVGIAVLPTVLQYLNFHYGLRNSIFLFGALLCNMIACGCGLRQPSTNEVHVADEEGEPEVAGALATKADNDSRKTRWGSVWCIVSDGIYRYFTTIHSHRSFFYLLVIFVIHHYILTSWSIFLVSFGLSRGLNKNEAVSLSIAGVVADALVKVSRLS